MALQQRLKFLQAKTMDVFGLAKRRFEGFGRQLGGYIEEGPGERGDWNLAPDSHLIGCMADVVPSDSRGRSCRPGHGDVDLTVISTTADTPELCGGTVTEYGSIATMEHGGEPVSISTNEAVTDGKYAWMKQMQSSRADSSINGAAAHPNLEELHPRHNPVLPSREAGHLPIQCARLHLASIYDAWSSLARWRGRHGRRVAPPGARVVRWV